MNLKAFSLVLAVLIAAATIYPPYLWGLERKTEWELLVRYEVPTRHTTMIPDFAPIKARGFLFGPNEKEIQAGWGWDHERSASIPAMELLKRQLSWEDLLLEYVLALCIAVVVGLLVNTRRKHLAKE